MHMTNEFEYIFSLSNIGIENGANKYLCKAYMHTLGQKIFCPTNITSGRTMAVLGISEMGNYDWLMCLTFFVLFFAGFEHSKPLTLAGFHLGCENASIIQKIRKHPPFEQNQDWCMRTRAHKSIAFSVFACAELIISFLVFHFFPCILDRLRSEKSADLFSAQFCGCGLTLDSPRNLLFSGLHLQRLHGPGGRGHPHRHLHPGHRRAQRHHAAWCVPATSDAIWAA